MNKQRESIYSLRRELLEGKIHLSEEDAVDTREYLMTLAEELIDSTADTYTGQEVDPEERDYEAMRPPLCTWTTRTKRLASESI